MSGRAKSVESEPLHSQCRPRDMHAFFMATTLSKLALSCSWNRLTRQNRARDLGHLDEHRGSWVLSFVFSAGRGVVWNLGDVRLQSLNFHVS